ncbi:solute carrier family 23 member 1-like isoform X2 [Xenia sp. Carnegie-2017]|uniref:solute carrier family 23 member 1-like isoform X2 n=1 Tax=Xenia sp. Carnegie-2017 TaxID=2897299 RepID=UPI001F04E0B4|nr:solute carrier family 23 member 1-like isoform X2 [Xenia sp. Carnegie-2017]
MDKIEVDISKSDDINASEASSFNSYDKITRQSKPFLEDPPASHLQLNYAIDENPPWHMALFLGFQHYLTMFGSTVALPLLLAKFMCVGNDGVAKSKLICTLFFSSGIATLLQSTFGVRLPIVQGGTYTFVSPTIAIMMLPKWKCPSSDLPPEVQQSNQSCWKNVCANETKATLPAFLKVVNKSASDPQQESEESNAWQPRVREIQGAIIVASLLQIVIGATGAMGFLLKFIGPLTITPAITLVGLSLFDVGADYASKHWGIAILTIILVIVFSQYMKNIKVILPAYNKTNGFYTTSVALFELFPVLFAVIISWLLCVILTASGAFEENHPVRTDTKVSILREAPWFRIPFPGQWGTPTVSVAAVIGMLAGVMAGIIESIGDYYACARLSGAPSVPHHALNRGVLVEGVCCMLAGAFGSGAGTTSYSENIGAIGITKVGSRRVIQYGGLFMLILAIFGKFGALFATIPEPIIGGVFIIMFGMVSAVGLSSLQFVDMNSARNLFIVGFSIFFGLLLPKWLQKNSKSIDTGADVLDQVIFVLLTTSVWVGGFTGFILDVTLPGTDQERGILKWRHVEEESSEGGVKTASIHTYDIPYLTRFTQKFPIVRYVPFLPYYPNYEGDVENAKQHNGTKRSNEGGKYLNSNGDAETVHL